MLADDGDGVIIQYTRYVADYRCHVLYTYYLLYYMYVYIGSITSSSSSMLSYITYIHIPYLHRYTTHTHTHIGIECCPIRNNFYSQVVN